MDKSTKLKYLALGLGASAVVGGIALYMMSGSETITVPEDLYNDEDLIKVAKLFKKEFFPAYEIAAGLSRQMLTMIAIQSRMNPRQIPKEMKDEIFKQAVSESNNINLFFFKTSSSTIKLMKFKAKF